MNLPGRSGSLTAISTWYPPHPTRERAVYPRPDNASFTSFSIDVVKTGSGLIQVSAIAFGPFSAYSRNDFNNFTPVFLVLERSICSGLKDEKTTISFFALVIATLSLLSPPSLFKGPKFKETFPFLSGP